MRKITLAAALAALTLTASAQIDVNRELYQDYVPLTDYIPAARTPSIRSGETERPDHINNAELKYYPPVFSQAGGSCGSASNEGYNFTYEMNCLLDRAADCDEHIFPSHWVYLLAYQHSDREDIIQKNGIPTAAVYGGRTYSDVFGEQECRDETNGRMQGYDKWYSAMFNRSVSTARFHSNLTTEEGREDLKNWLWNHHGDPDFHAGGVACVGVAITDSKIARTRPTANNRANKLHNKSYITTWGPNFDHSVTIVGYDDRIEFDLDGDQQYGEVDEDEVGAWIICNSWGTGWGDGGFVYCPYKYGYSVGTSEIPMTPGRWILRKFYKPERVFRITMEYSHRSELQLVAGVSESTSSQRPTQTVTMPMFNYDGNPGNVSPAPEVPMLGMWADGKMHTEPMQFGFDVTDLTAMVDKAKPLKYFFQINTASGSIGTGKVHEFTLMNYENGLDSIEGLQVGVETVDIAGKGKTTYLTLIVPGLGNYRPTTPTVADGIFSWKAPQESEHQLTRYLIYQNGVLTDSVAASEVQYALPDATSQAYLQVAAVYVDKEGKRLESKRTDAISPVCGITTASVALRCPLDGTYLALLRSLTSRRLVSIDLSAATIVEGGDAYNENYHTANNEFGAYLFNKCTRLKTLVLPANTVAIGERAASECSALTQIVIPDNVTTMGMDCFAYNSHLTKAVIGSSVSDIGQGAFYSSPVSDAYVKPLTPPSIAIYLFSSKPTIHVYSDVLADYEASSWADYGHLVGDLEKYYPREETGIYVLRPTDDDPQPIRSIFTLDGRPIPSVTTPGIYIVNGKKTFVR